jgi:hypothetical protein
MSEVKSMILLKEILQEQNSSKVSCTYTPSVKTYNIVTECMSDDCKPLQLGNGICIWLDDSGRLGEVECIYPKIMEQSSFKPTFETKKLKGIPTFKTNSSGYNGCLEELEEGFTIWLSEMQKVDQEICQDKIRYLLNGEQLVGILASNFEVIE